MEVYSPFSVGDLVRQRSILASKSSGYGIIVDIMPSNIKCIWVDEEIRRLQPKQLYLIARGQKGKIS
tara:strand:+ start:634 stop:834 length:201 start_codon:yes stop_codon:yes gene_type:complete